MLVATSRPLSMPTVAADAESLPCTTDLSMTLRWLGLLLSIVISRQASDLPAIQFPLADLSTAF